MFLNNNYHSVHHANPAMPWHALPQEYADHQAAYLAENGAYLVNGYREIVGKYAFTAKEPVRHPAR